jgi:outer membrane protein OmpA-like peptidoglycan-associated protein
LRIGWSVGIALVCAVALAQPALAQSAGYQLNRFEPPPAGDPFTVVEYPWYSATRWFAGGLTLDYAHDLLVAKGAAAPIANQLDGHLDLAGSLFDRVALTLSAPMVLFENGTAFNGVGPTGVVAGDPRVGLRGRLFGQPDARFSLSASVYLWIPIGEQHNLTGDTGVRVLPRLTVGGLWREHLRWALNAGFLYRATAQLSATVAPAGNTVGSEVQLAAGLDYVALDRRFSVGPEATLSLAVAPNLPSGQQVATLELFGAAHYLVADLIQLGLGVGAAVAGSPGPPDFRLVFSIGWAPLRAHLSRFERVLLLPDEDGHVGGVVVDDGKSRTVLDKAYASTELSKKDKRARQVQSSPQALPPSVAVLARALPPPDRDADGIADAQDACPDRPGVPSPDPIRNGCPKASEKVLVLPDADGHVGGVEVDDGKRRTLIDRPYAGVEVGADGSVHAVPPATAKAVQRSVAAIAGALPAPDFDDDGVLDGEDACPDRAGVASADPLRNGCPAALERMVLLPDPDGHVGGVEVDDGKTKTLVAEAYASAEVAPDGRVRAAPPSLPSAIVRAVAALASAMPIADQDGDGIRDEDDACPERAGVASADPLRNGCPKAAERVVLLPDADGHVGGVEVDDGSGKTVLDRAYATAEVGADGRAHEVASSPVYATRRAVKSIADAMPIPDRDDDGIADGLDACPDRAGVPSADPAHNGCPRTVEEVVVLADESGHVGGVEVDDGQSRTLLDQGYAASEVGTDGRARKLTASPDEVAKKFAQAMAAQPPGARMIIYFNRRAEPVRDLTGPIANLVAEVKERATYTIEVVGHTDERGSKAANVRIGLARAQLIADRLIAAGVPADRVQVISKGMSEPAVVTQKKSVAELRNRRVEVFVR